MKHLRVLGRPILSFFDIIGVLKSYICVSVYILQLLAKQIVSVDLLHILFGCRPINMFKLIVYVI